MKLFCFSTFLMLLCQLGNNDNIISNERIKEKSFIKTVFMQPNDVGLILNINQKKESITSITYNVTCNKGILSASTIFENIDGKDIYIKENVKLKKYLEVWEYLKNCKLWDLISLPPNDNTNLDEYFNELRFGRENISFEFGILESLKSFSVYDIKMVKNKTYYEILNKISGLFSRKMPICD